MVNELYKSNSVKVASLTVQTRATTIPYNNYIVVGVFTVNVVEPHKQINSIFTLKFNIHHTNK